MTAIADMTSAALTDAYRRGELSPVDVVRDTFERIDKNAAFNAFVVVDREAALEAATRSEVRWRTAAPLGPIDGVLATIKDNILAKGLPTRRGSKTSDSAPATRRSSTRWPPLRGWPPTDARRCSPAT